MVPTTKSAQFKLLAGLSISFIDLALTGHLLLATLSVAGILLIQSWLEQLIVFFSGVAVYMRDKPKAANNPEVHFDSDSPEQGQKMQTFLPLPDFYSSARVLDYRRLGKQRVEAKQLINVIEAWEKNPGAKMAWINHPAAVMWRGYLPALKLYANVMIEEWIHRGYKNTMKFYDFKGYKLPSWLGDKKFHASHRSNLLRKDPIFYSQYGWQEPNTLEYFWPGMNYTKQEQV